MIEFLWNWSTSVDFGLRLFGSSQENDQESWFDLLRSYTTIASVTKPLQIFSDLSARFFTGVEELNLALERASLTTFTYIAVIALQLILYVFV